jgi:hypothetical protein
MVSSLLPKTGVKDALRIDRETATDFWQKVIELEMKAIDCAFEFRDVGYQHIDCHMIFDVKITLDREARYIAAGHQTEPSKDIMFASVVSRDSIRHAYTVAALNDLEVLSADVSGAYLNATRWRKKFTLLRTQSLDRTTRLVTQY